MTRIRMGAHVLALVLVGVPTLARAQVAPARAPSPASTIFARKVEAERRLVVPRPAARALPVVRPLSVRGAVRSDAPARRLRVAQLQLTSRVARAADTQVAAPATVTRTQAARAPAPVAPVTAETPAPSPPSARSSAVAGAATLATAPVPAQVPAPARAPGPVPGPAPAPEKSLAQQQGAGWAHVTYISGPSIYIDAGTRAGLREGSRLQVVRGSSAIAELVVAYVSSSRASCTVTSSSAAVAVGDSARFTPVREVMEQARPVVASADSAPRRSPRRTVRPIRGRVGVRYLAMEQGGGGATTTLTQPAFDLRLDGQHINGTPFGLVVDVRAYRQNYERASGSTLTNSTRVYQTALLWNPVDAGVRVALGRQFSTALSPVGLFDGAAFDLDRRHWSVGGFSGSQPEPRSFGYSGDVREHGAYVQWHNGPNEGAPWSFTAGAIGSYAGGKIDREFGYLQGMFNNRHLSLYAAQEIDVNRGWKAGMETSSATPTSTFATMRVSANDAFTIFAGYDNRRSVRLYRDFLDPQTAFDDSFRQGAWGGASLYVLGHLRLSGDVRTSRGGAAGTADSYTGSVQVSRLTPLQLGVQLRNTRYTGTLASGDLTAASFEFTPFGTLRLQANGGRRTDSRAADALGNPLTDSRTTWWGLDADVGLARSLYLMASTYRETGQLTKNLQSYLAVSLRF